MAASVPLPRVQLTRVFTDALLADGADPDTLVDAVAEWKRSWPAREDKDYYFGKDGEYHTPKRQNKAVLRHVHMPPEDPNHWPATETPLSGDEYARIIKEVAQWDTAWEHRRSSRYRTSSRVLVYVDGGRHGYLLLHLAREPTGHDEATANASLMQKWADVAEAFIHDGFITS